MSMSVVCTSAFFFSCLVLCVSAAIKSSTRQVVDGFLLVLFSSISASRQSTSSSWSSDQRWPRGLRVNSLPQTPSALLCALCLMYFSSLETSLLLSPTSKCLHYNEQASNRKPVFSKIWLMFSCACTVKYLPVSFTVCLQVFCHVSFTCPVRLCVVWSVTEWFWARCTVKVVSFPV